MLRRMLLCLAPLTPLACSQTSVTPANVLTYVPVDRVLQAKAGATVEARLSFELRSGYHVNSNTPAEDYLIPLKLTWSPGPMAAGEIVYPRPSLERFSFSKVPLSVFTNNFQIVTRFSAPAKATPGPAMLSARLRYQACNDRMCLPPKNLDVKLPVEIVK